MDHYFTGCPDSSSGNIKKTGLLGEEEGKGCPQKMQASARL